MSSPESETLDQQPDAKTEISPKPVETAEVQNPEALDAESAKLKAEYTEKITTEATDAAHAGDQFAAATPAEPDKPNRLQAFTTSMLKLGVDTVNRVRNGDAATILRGGNTAKNLAEIQPPAKAGAIIIEPKPLATAGPAIETTAIPGVTAEAAAAEVVAPPPVATETAAIPTTAAETVVAEVPPISTGVENHLEDPTAGAGEITTEAVAENPGSTEPATTENQPATITEATPAEPGPTPAESDASLAEAAMAEAAEPSPEAKVGPEEQEVIDKASQERGGIFKRIVTSETFSLVVGVTPLLGEGLMVGEAIAGRRLTGEEMSTKRRIIEGTAGTGLLILSFTGVGAIASEVGLVGRTIPKLTRLSAKAAEKGLPKVKGIIDRSIRFGAEHPNTLKFIEEHATTGIKKGETAAKAVKANRRNNDGEEEQPQAENPAETTTTETQPSPADAQPAQTQVEWNPQPSGAGHAEQNLLSNYENVSITEAQPAPVGLAEQKAAAAQASAEADSNDAAYQDLLNQHETTGRPN